MNHFIYSERERHIRCRRRNDIQRHAKNDDNSKESKRSNCETQKHRESRSNRSRHDQDDDKKESQETTESTYHTALNKFGEFSLKRIQASNRHQPEPMFPDNA